MPRGVMTVALIVAVAGIVVVAGAYAFLPGVLGGMIERKLQSDLGLETEPRAEVSSDSPLAMLAGEFSGARVVLQQPVFGGVRADRAVIRLDPFHLDMLQTVLGGELHGRGIISGGLEVELSEREVERVVAASTKAPVSGVELDEDLLTLESSVSLLGVEVPISVEGKLLARSEYLVYRPVRASAMGFAVPEKVSRELVSGASFRHRLRDLPYGARMTGIKVMDESVVFSGTVERLALG